MKNRITGKQPLFVILLLFCLVFPSPHLPAAAADAKYQQKLKVIDDRINAINNSIGKLEKDKNTLTKSIATIDLNYRKESVERKKIKLQLTDIEEKISLKVLEKKDLEATIEKSKQNLEKILRILYKVGGNTYLKLFVRVDSLDQLYKNYRLFVSLVNYKADEINTIKKNIKRLNVVKTQLHTEQTNLVKLQKLQEKKLANIKRLRWNKKALIKKINSDRQKYIQMLDELSVESQHLTQIISGNRIKSSKRVINLNRLKGRFKWPLRGKVISSFGKKKSTRFNTYVVNNGIKVRPTHSKFIKSIYLGEVVFAEYYKSYGNVIMVRHSRDLLTLYGHCEKFLKKVGAPVLTGEDIAVVGDTGTTVGKTLYFEIRIDTVAENPTKWLGKRR